MFELFFGDLWSVLSTVFLLVALVYIVWTAIKHGEIRKWGKRTLIIAIIGISLCMCVVFRDDYMATMQGGKGVFPLDSLQISLAYFGGAVIGFSALSSIFVRNQKYRKIMFFILSSAIIFKSGLIEISRVMLG